MKKIIFITLLLCSSIIFSQTSEGKISLAGNKYTIELQKKKGQKIRISFTNTTNENSAVNYDIDFARTESYFVEDIKSKLTRITKEVFVSNKLFTKYSMPWDSIRKFEYFLDSVKIDTSLIRKEFLEKTEIKDFTYSNLVNTFNNEEGGNKIKLLEGLLVKKISDGNYTLNLDGDIKSFKDEKGFDKLITATVADSNLVFRALFKESEYKKQVSKDFTTANRKILSKLYMEVLGKNKFIFLDNIKTQKGALYDVSSEHDGKEKYFVLQICKSALSDCRYSPKVSFDIQFSDLSSEIDSLTLKDTEDSISETTKQRIYDKLKIRNVSTRNKYVMAPITKERDSLISLIENAKTEYSGALKLNSNIPIYLRKYDKRGWFRNKYKGDEKLNDFVFQPKSATTRFFNNRIKEIVVVGDVVNKEAEVIKEDISINYSYSIPIRALNINTHSVGISNDKIVKDKRDLVNIRYDDLFNYYPYKNKYNSATKNAEYEIKVNDTVKIEQKQLLNYFTPIIFSDFLGLNSSSENGLLFAEGRARIPLWIRNFGKHTFISALRTDINVIISNGFSSDDRSITQASTVAFGSDVMKFHAFDLIKYANLNANISIDFYNYEMKGFSTDVSFGGGIRYYRSSLVHTQTNGGINGVDVITNDQVNALAPEVNVNFQIRPQTNFGADFNIAYSWINVRGSKENATIQLDSPNHRGMVRVNLDLYSKIDSEKSNGGIYARIGGFYQPNKKDFYPQIMVGYATNLSSFVNKFKKEEK